MPVVEPATTEPWMTATTIVVVLAVAGWILLWCWIWGWFLPAGRRRLDADDVSAFCTQLGWLWTRRVHGYRIEGFTPEARALLDDSAAGPVIVVCNHVAGVDPILVQLSMRRRLRWFMAAEQMVGVLGWFWRLQKIIPVHYDRRDTQSLMVAMTHLRAGGALGVFPEGGIARPSGQIYRFMPGFASLAGKMKARVVVLSLRGIPANAGVLWSLVIPCSATLRLLAVLEPPPPAGIDAFTERVRAMIADDLGVPLADRHLDHIEERIAQQPANPSR
ncbi:MAG: 1-acyl-sn-glycerol-3-phosphate acyltransferase [Phycisphaerae bacterium]|nr:1-acyl-sn-glycerol-3-phosphate acyltransferase [Phycisphaerae bacterium]